MAFIKLPENILTDPNITDLQIRIIANLIRYSYNDNKSYIGYDKLAAACMITKRAAINNIKKLEYLGYLRVNHRGNFSRSNEIELTLNRIQGVNAESPLELCTGVNVESPLNDNQGVNADSPVGEYRFTPHIDNRFKYIDLNKKEKKEKVNENSPLNDKELADVAANRSMPCVASDAETMQKTVCAADLAAKIQAIKSYFGPKIHWIEIFEISNNIGFRVCDMTLDNHLSGIDIEAAKGFAALHNIIFTNKHFAAERKIA